MNTGEVDRPCAFISVGARLLETRAWEFENRYKDGHSDKGTKADHALIRCECLKCFAR